MYVCTPDLPMGGGGGVVGGIGELLTIWVSSTRVDGVDPPELPPWVERAGVIIAEVKLTDISGDSWLCVGRGGSHTGEGSGGICR